MKSAKSSFELPILVVFSIFCEHTDTQTDTQYDYHTLTPTVRGEDNNFMLE